jgi:hypothetical protein
MRRALLIVLLGGTTGALLVGTAAATATSTAFKTGTYKLKPAGYTVTLKHARCAGKLQFCVALPKSRAILCKGGPNDNLVRVGNFATPVALPSSGKVTERAPISEPPTVPAGPPSTGKSAFSIAFKNNGTASGYIEVSLKGVIGPESISCSGKMSFTAKLA